MTKKLKSRKKNSTSISKSKVHNTSSAQETFELGRKFSKKLKPGDVICLTGNLGAGKTVFVKGIAKGLGIKNNILSPTFVLCREYPVNKKGKLCHIDLYRINENQFVSSGFEQYFNNENICAIEWAERIKPILPKKRIDIKITIEKNDIRKIRVITNGNEYRII